MPLPNPYIQLMTPLEALSIKMLTGFSPLSVVVGEETGIGKSMIVARSSELIYWRTYQKIWLPQIIKNNKIIETNLFFFMNDFKQELFNANHRILINEEAEIELGSDNWTSIENRWFSRMKSTQRIKGNLYFVILPMFSLLAKKHRRATNYIWDVKSKGFANCYKIKKLPANIDGDDIYKLYIGSIKLNLPDCKIQYELMDTENKKKIEIEEGYKYDFEKHEGNKKLNKYKEFVKNKGKIKEDIKSVYVYKCHACGKEFESKHEIGRVIKCNNCGQKVYIDIQNLISSPNSLKNDSENDD